MTRLSGLLWHSKLLFHLSLSCTVTTWWLDSDSVATVVNCRQHGDYTAICSSVTTLPAVINDDYTVTVQSQCSDCLEGDWWNRSFAVMDVVLPDLMRSKSLFSAWKIHLYFIHLYVILANCPSFYKKICMHESIWNFGMSLFFTHFLSFVLLSEIWKLESMPYVGILCGPDFSTSDFSWWSYIGFSNPNFHLFNH